MRRTVSRESHSRHLPAPHQPTNRQRGIHVFRQTPCSYCFSLFVGGDRAGASDRRDRGGSRRQHRRRSEEHTSELQSLMRISYAVFCLKKKNKQKKPQANKI